MSCKVNYCGEWEPATCIEITKDELGQEFCTIVLDDDPRVVLEVPTKEVVWSIM